jgi:hypothetical protein
MSRFAAKGKDVIAMALHHPGRTAAREHEAEALAPVLM